MLLDDTTTPIHHQTIRRISLGRIQSMSQPIHGQGFYFLFFNDQLVYIGQSKNCTRRIGQHSSRQGKGLFNRYAFVPFETDHLMNRIEKHLIKKFAPRYNKAGNPDSSDKVGLNGHFKSERMKKKEKDAKEFEEYKLACIENLGFVDGEHHATKEKRLRDERWAKRVAARKEMPN